MLRNLKIGAAALGAMACVPAVFADEPALTGESLRLDFDPAAIHDVSLTTLQNRDRVDMVDSWGPMQGDWEFTLTGSGSSDQDLDNNALGFSISVGKFLTDEWLLSLRQSLTWTDVEGGDSSAQASTRVAIDYHFDFDQLRPFIGANIGYVYGEDLNDTFAAGVEGGLKWYVKPETFVFGMVEWQYFFDDADDIEDRFDDGQFVYSFGVGFNF